MSDFKHRLNKSSSQRSVNVDGYSKISLSSNYNLLPIGEVNKIINSAEQFNEERRNSNLYRLSGSISPLFTNVLFNTSGESSWKSFNNNLFRDRTFPPDGISLDDEEDFTYLEAIEAHLKEDDGWFGYKSPDQSLGNICTWIDMQPDRTKFSLSPKNNIKNWELTITYPVTGESLEGDITFNGLLIINSVKTLIGGRNMTTFTTPVKHGLSVGETVSITLNSNGPTINDGKYTVIRLGDNKVDNKEYHFTLDISDDIILDSDLKPRMARYYNGERSSYYFRKFKKVNVRDTKLEIENDDYEIFPLAFSQNLYEDKINHFVINEDIDITGLVDNLNRPLSELFITMVKTDTGGVFTPIKSGIEIPFLVGVSGDSTIPDIRLINNSSGSHYSLKDNIKIDDPTFYGDVAEYNRLEQIERILGKVNHTFNTTNREIASAVNNIDFNSPSVNLDLGIRYESYFYNPHTRIKLREYSSYIEEGTIDTLDLPTYSIPMGDGRYLWRDLLDVGTNDMNEDILDYPFMNGVHYIDSNVLFPLKRQDPFNLYGVQYTSSPPDTPGTMMDDNNESKTSEDGC